MESAGPRVLLVDDDPSAVSMMSRMLSHYPRQRFATCGADAMRLAHEATPDLIVLDADMPGMTGLDVCDALSVNADLARVPIIFASSHSATSAVEQAALNKGAADFVAKPLVATRLVARARARLTHRKLVEAMKLDHHAVIASMRRCGTHRPRILLVDDDVVALRALRHMLEDLGDVHFARTADEALRLSEDLGPDLVLLDLQMPEDDGFETCARLKQQQVSTQHLPIAFVTRFCDPRMEMKALGMGAADFISKVSAPGLVRARIRNLLDVKLRTDNELRAIGDQWRLLGDARVAEIVGSASDAIVSVDANGLVVLANRAAGKMFDPEHQGLIGRPASAVLGAAARALLAPQSPGRIELSRPGGGNIAAELSLSRTGEGAQCVTTMQLRDVSDRERLAAQTTARAEAEAQSRLKSTMLSYIAHEVGNPLNAVLGFAQLMGLDTTQPLPPAHAKRLDQIVVSGRQIETLMRDLIELGRSESGALAVDLRSIDVSGCVERAVTAVSASALENGVVIHHALTGEAVAARVDASRLGQCLANLLTNAVKYNRQGGRIDVLVTRTATTVDIAISDTGLGLDERQLEHLFEPFNRLGRQHGKTPGTGLGLVITRKLVEAMHGRLKVDSEVGVGSRFTISLPRGSDAHGVHPSTSSADTGG